MLIYRAQNRIDGKIYIGQTTRSLDERKKEHVRDFVDTYFSRAIHKDSPKFFDWQVIDQAVTEQELNEKEKYWVAFYKSFDPDFGYNETTGGEGGSPTEATRRKISLANTGKVRTSIVKKKLSDAHSGCKNHNYGCSPSESTREKISQSLLGRHPSEESRRKMSESQKLRFRNHPFSEEDKLKRSLILKGRPKSKDEQLRLKSLRKGKTISEEHKRKLHEGYLRYCNSKKAGGAGE